MRGNHAISNAEVIEKVDDLSTRVENIENIVKGDDRLGTKGLYSMTEESNKMTEENKETIVKILTTAENIKSFAKWGGSIFLGLMASGVIPLVILTTKKILQ